MEVLVFVAYYAELAGLQYNVYGTTDGFQV